MAIPNPNPNIADGVKSDVTTYSSNKIESLISVATELPIPAAGDAGKVLTVNSDSDGYELDVIPSEVPTPAAGDASKVISVNADSDGYELTTPITFDDVETIATAIMTEEKTGEVTAGTDIVLTSSNLKQVGDIAQLSIAVSDTTTATLARWGSYTIGSVDIVPKYEISGLTKVRLGATDWFDVNYSIDTSGNLKINDIYGVTAGTITGLYLTVMYIV